MRLWGIRHIRYFWHAFWFEQHLATMQRAGLGSEPQRSDVDHLIAIWKGRA